MKSSEPSHTDAPTGSAPTFTLARLVSSGLGSGFAPVASGTVGSACACVMWLFLLSPPRPLSIAVACAVAACLLGFACTHRVINDPKWRANHLAKGSHKGHLDPKEVVIDEWAGMLITLLPLSALPSDATVHILLGSAGGFFLFRALDVLKPGLIGRAEKLPGAMGIMADDIVAGICGASILALFLFAMYPT